jgi:hypothetical protein
MRCGLHRICVLQGVHGWPSPWPLHLMTGVIKVLPRTASLEAQLLGL